MTLSTRIARQLLCLFFCALSPAFLNAATEREAEASFKAAVVFKIAKFVSWPDADVGRPMRFCVAGRGLLLNALENFTGRSVHGRNVSVLEVRAPADVPGNCDVLYLSRGMGRSAADWTYVVADKPVLTFGEAGFGGGKESIVVFRIRRDKVRFEINLEANRDTGLTISARLLQLAASTTGRGGD